MDRVRYPEIESRERERERESARQIGKFVSADPRKTLEYFSRTVLAFYIGARGANLSLSLFSSRRRRRRLSHGRHYGSRFAAIAASPNRTRRDTAASNEGIAMTLSFSVVRSRSTGGFRARTASRDREDTRTSPPARFHLPCPGPTCWCTVDIETADGGAGAVASGVARSSSSSSSSKSGV